MKTEVAPTGTARELAATTEAAVRLLSEGHPVALPTETVYGLAAPALNTDAVLRVVPPKERPYFDPLIVHHSNREWPEDLCEIPTGHRGLIRRIADRSWPGPLTIILPRQAIVPDLVTAGLRTVAARMGSHPVFRQSIELLDQP